MRRLLSAAKELMGAILFAWAFPIAILALGLPLAALAAAIRAILHAR
jgi:hypothetical protein